MNDEEPEVLDEDRHKRVGMQRLQEAAFGTDYDYRVGSPHLRHWRLYDNLVAMLRQAMQRLAANNMPLTVLEVGAGHGGYTEISLALGCDVTATEMSRHSVARLEERFSTNPRLRTLFDRDGTLSDLGTDRFSLILCASLLHHIPDYLSFIDRAVSAHLLPGGTFLSVQDPMWYPELNRGTRLFERAAYLSWRMTQGNWLVGAKTFSRRLRRVYDDTNPSDMVEYHTVRQGVDQDAILNLLKPRFRTCSLITYWSTQGPPWQLVGDRLKMRNTFAIAAEEYSGHSVS